MIDALTGVLIIPAVAAGLLAILPGYRLTARLNVFATLLTFLTAVSLFVVEPRSGSYLLVDDLNKVFIVLTTFVGFTTSVFSASYIGHEIETGRLPPTFMLLPPHSWHDDVWSDVAQMLSLITIQSAKGAEKHLCPLPFDIVCLRDV